MSMVMPEMGIAHFGTREGALHTKCMKNPWFWGVMSKNDNNQWFGGGLMSKSIEKPLVFKDS